MTQFLKNKKGESTLIYLDELLLLFYLLIVTLLFGYYIFLQGSYGILVFFIYSLGTFIRRAHLFLKQKKLDEQAISNKKD